MEKLNIDCLVLIFDELLDDSNSLYSCLLVNREWCNLVVPILWAEYPHYYLRMKIAKEKLSNVILSCLPTSSKQLLFDNNIKLPLTNLSIPLTFNYVSFFKDLKVKTIYNIINLVFKKEILIGVNYSKRRNLLEQEIYKLYISQCKSIKSLEWKTSQSLPSFPGALTCFSQLYSLDIGIDYINPDNLYDMAQICKDLNELFVYNISQDILGLIYLIDVQKNLKNVSFDFKTKKKMCKELSITLARKGGTINNLTLYNSIGVISHSFLTSLINLKDLTIDHDNDCASYEEVKEFQKHLANSKFSDLQSLEIAADLLCFKELAMLVEKTKGNLSSIFIYTFSKSSENTGMFLKTISNHCPKIEYLSTYIGPKDLIYVKSLLMNCRNLINLCLRSLNENDDIGDELLDILTNFSPKVLTDITIYGGWKYSIDVLEKFFESYRGRKLRFFIYYNYIEYNIHIVDVVKKYYSEGIIIGSNLLHYSV
ncbi:hypothetical protein RclHR1_06940001 [Rhizophagus clarus]|uniref:F-box domain-containing protein n=1 Tax=Rhizophagus clarus TaxID=94130 RepID=A0A2Z6RV11_9GLOM|nr:hypothetical protein RclHR1_06940001 [Rhizophagus clarus]GES81025.1 hypothetical protein GLOIN_2v1810914 [Rhizophagus clarus]